MYPNTQKTLSQRLQLAILAALGVFLFTLFTAPVAQALTISPPRLELDADPGGTATSEFKIINDSSEAVTYYTQVENFEAKDETGNPSFVSAPEGLATWIQVATTVRVGPGEDASVPFTVRVPRNAEPGGYFASIFVRTTPPPARGGGEVSIGARLGTLILFRVNGEIQEGVNILEFATKDKKRFYNSLPVELYYRFQNTGADRVRPKGDIVIKNIIGMKAKVLSANRTEGSVLPRSIRRFESPWINGGGGQEDPTATVQQRTPGGFFEEAKYQWSHFAFGYYTANLDITFGQNNTAANQTFRFFVFPWQLLVLIVGGLLVAIIVIRLFLKRYNRYIVNKHSK